ncbi:MAG: bifunctional UDP-sugar hydrolase/5'-nucleotidase [Pseudomonadota bacterium]
MQPISLFLTSSALALSATTALADFTITILHTNDFHARFEPISRFDSTCSAEDNAAGECFGGSARLVTAVEEARARADTSILVDAGDQFQGTLIHAYYRGAASAEIMGIMDYDVMAIGNHEFNHGPEILREFIDAVDFPVLMANAEFADEPALAGAVPGSVVLEVEGEQLGFIGLTPENNAELSSPGPNVTFTDPIAATQAEVEALTAAGVNKIIVLSHSGLPVDLELAEAVPEIDVIIGGHSHTLLSNSDDDAAGPSPTMVGNTAIVQAYAYSKFLGELTVTFDDAGVLTAAEGEPILLDASVEEDAATVARIAELAQPIEEIRAEVVAESAAPIEGDRSVCRAEECEMGNLVADAMLDRVRDQGVQIALQNGGGLRASIDAGPVTMGEVLTVLPFQNTLSTFQVTGAVLLAALENGVSQVEDGAGRFPQVAGMSFVWDPAAAPGSRIVEVMIDTEAGPEPLDPDAVYGMVSNNFIRGGGDGYAMFATDAINAYDYGPDLADVTAEYLAANAPYTPYVATRITAR